MDQPFNNSSTDHQSHNAGTNGQPVRRTSSSSNLLSTSFSQRPPARSFVTQATLNSQDPAQYSSYGVREQTAELASFAFADNAILPPHTSSSRRSSSTTLRNHPRSFIQHEERKREPSQPLLSDLIEETSRSEVSERLQPSRSNPQFNRQSRGQREESSALSSMFRKSPPYRAHITSNQTSKLQRISDKTNNQEQNASLVSHEEVDENSPLLGHHTNGRDRRKSPLHETSTEAEDVPDVERQKPLVRKRNKFFQLSHQTRNKTVGLYRRLANPKSWNARDIWNHGVKEPISLLPCVFLGLLLNVLDALSYGMILFPLGEDLFSQTGPDGISMFYVSCIVSQLVYSCGGSIFKGAVGSEMIEVVPFFHKMTYTIMNKTGKTRPDVVLATVITSYALSSIITGLVFFILGAFKLGSLVSFFPRHILIGCIGGVGFFLFVTGIEVSARLKGNLEYNLETARQLFKADTVPLWIVPLVLSIVLMVLQRFIRSPYVTPGFFIGVAVIFYITVASVQSINIPLLRDQGWVFSAVQNGVPFYHFYSYYNFSAVDWKALGSTIPAMFALTFFGILHVPINIPALGMAAQEDDLNLNRELVAHGMSNALSGFAGSIQNYLVYVNSAMFIENGGNNRLAGLLLAAATCGVWVAGPEMIGYVPVMVVGALIFYLGIALLEEALYDTIGKMSILEYLTVWAIVLVMGIYDFVGGILVGIILALLNFVVQTSRKSAIRATYSGEVVESTVRRHVVQRQFLHDVGSQIYVTKLAGFLFFGSIVRVEKQSRALIEEEAFNKEPIRFLVFDLFHVNGLDYSAAEAFSRMERILQRRQVRMIVSGCCADSDVAKSLRNVGLWTEESNVQFFETLNDALEYCENELLKAFYRHRDARESSAPSRNDSWHTSKPEDIEQASTGVTEEPVLSATPRQQYLTHAATATLDNERNVVPKKWQSFRQPLPLLLQTFQEITDKNEDFWFKAVPYFERIEHPANTVIFSAGEDADGFYLLESGILHAQYDLSVGTYHESIVSGTTCGELPFFSDTPRTATVSTERDSVTWRLSGASWYKMREEWSEGAQEILQVAMKLTKERVDKVVSYVLVTAG